MTNINPEILEEVAPQIMLDCQVALSSLDETNENHTLAISSLMNMLDLLQEAGIKPYSTEEVAEALKEEELYQLSPQELADLKAVIAQSESPNAKTYTTQEVLENVKQAIYSQKVSKVSA